MHAIAERTFSRMQIARMAWAVLICLMLAGCGDRVNLANYEKITPGMTKEQVIEILGEPGGSYQGIVTWDAKDPSKSITITFAEGKVMDKTLRGF